MDTSVGLTVEGLVEMKHKMDELNKGCRHEAPIYGHLHNTNHRNIERLTEKQKHKLIYLEHEYKPFSLRKLVEGR